VVLMGLNQICLHELQNTRHDRVGVEERGEIGLIPEE
jgi:hypothetical protein